MINVGKHVIMINDTIDGVKFINLPGIINEDDSKFSYPLNSWAIAEVIASKIDDMVKPYVTIDFEKVDRKPFMLILNDGQEYVPPEKDPEAELLKLWNLMDGMDGVSEN